MGVITWNLVIYTLLGFLLGYGAWQKFGVPQWLMAVTSLIGMGLGFFQIFRMFREQK
jgi:F0F1-type ATP synthase assembly protein I